MVGNISRWVLLGSVVFIAGCKTMPSQDTRISADQWPSISGNYATRAQEIGEKYPLAVETPSPAPTPTPAITPTVMPKPVVQKSAPVVPNRSTQGESFGSVLVAGNGEIKFPVSFMMVRKAIVAAEANKEVLAFKGHEVIVGRASLTDPRSAKRDFIVFYKQNGLNQIAGPRIDTEVLPFIRQATGCNISPKIGEREMKRLPMNRTVVFPIHCGKV